MEPTCPFAYQTRLLERMFSSRPETPTRQRWMPSHRIAPSLDSDRGKWDPMPRSPSMRTTSPPATTAPQLKRHTLTAHVVAFPLSPNTTGISVENPNSPASASPTPHRIRLPTASPSIRGFSSDTPSLCSRRSNTLDSSTFALRTLTSPETDHPAIPHLTRKRNEHVDHTEEIPLRPLCRQHTPHFLHALAMKFSSALKFNAVADWWDKYIAYDVLKRRIYQLEKEHHRLSRINIDLEANERTALVGQPDFSSDCIFIPLLDQELQKISLFYEEKEKELFAALQTLEEFITEQDEAGAEAWEHYMDDYADEEDDDDDEQIVSDHRRITNLYVSFSSLKSYVEVNHSGFRKILKKYDKVTYNELKDRYMHDIVEARLPFLQSSKDKVTAARLVTLYAKCVTSDDPNTAVQQLKERRGASDPSDFVGGGILAREEECGIVVIPTPFGGFKLKRQRVSLVIAIAVFIVLMNMHVIKDGPEASKCFAILIFSTIMWASEAIPLFVTSTLVPFLLVVFRVIRSDGEDPVPLSTPDATKFVFSVMFSPTVMLLVGGLTISAALSKTNIDRMLITRLLSMVVSCFASMWISSELRLPPTLAVKVHAYLFATKPYRHRVHGPQLDWGSWFAVALPVSIISVLLIWLLLLVSYQPARAPDGHGETEIRAIRPTREAFTLKQYWVVVVCLVTIVLWCIEHQIEDTIGDMGIITIIPIVAFFATGVLKKVTSSGLMDTMDGVTHRMLEDRTLYSVVIVLSITVLIVSTFISHTIASVLLVPIAQQVGKDLPGDHANLLIFLTGLICSTGMGMPVSGFPNQLACIAIFFCPIRSSR
ncbi:SPX domain-containing protein [Boletus edulis BED1]|uniref:SPX domain-containing protein n=1 Tax=Boletus edulis BED1 TaxID=1328754 RepID=A0AAD4G6K6_BOLED|nr:SPX domain-containing protein [Boletus edulis BED1]